MAGGLGETEDTGRTLEFGLDADELTLTTAIPEVNDSRNASEQRVILAEPNVLARFVLGAALPDQDGPAGHNLAAECLNTEPLSV